MKKLAQLFGPGLVALFFTATGGLIGAYFQQYFDTRLQEEKTLLELRKDAYTAFFKGQAALQQLVNAGARLSEADAESMRAEYTRSVTNARFSVAIFSSKPVVDAMANFFLAHHHQEDCVGARQKWLDDAKIYQNMRQELFGSRASQRVDEKNLLLMMFNCRLRD